MDNELRHYGVKGMKWGVRRYQNKDGSLTPAGKKHVNDYKTHRSNLNNLRKQGDKVINSNTTMKRMYGEGKGTYNPVYKRDDRFLNAAKNSKVDEKVVNDYLQSVKTYDSFLSENRESIKRGKQIVKKLGYK